MARGQGGSEYLLIAALVFVLVSAVLLTGFKNVEIDLALSSTRLACMEMTAMNSSLECYSLSHAGYEASYNITPSLSSGYTAGQKTMLKTKALEKMRDTFHPDDAGVDGDCFFAAFKLYCVVVS